MALVRSASLTSISGSIGGMTFARNRGGLYVRNRSGTTNPNSPRQQTVRTSLANLATQWSALTPTRQQGWIQYASVVSVTNRLGEATKLSGQQQFLRTNINRLAAGLLVINDAPTIFNLGELSPVACTAITFPANVCSFTFNNEDPWATETGGALMIFQGRAQSTGVQFYKGPWRYIGRVNGASTPPTSPATIGALLPIATGQRVWFRAVAATADGRLSTQQIFFRVT